MGSYGRYPGVKGISDLDFIMSDSLWETYKDKSGTLLSEVKEALLEGYPTKKVRKDSLVVVVEFADLKFEVQLVF